MKSALRHNDTERVICASLLWLAPYSDTLPQIYHLSHQRQTSQYSKMAFSLMTGETTPVVSFNFVSYKGFV